MIVLVLLVILIGLTVAATGWVGEHLPTVLSGLALALLAVAVAIGGAA